MAGKEGLKRILAQIILVSLFLLVLMVGVEAACPNQATYCQSAGATTCLLSHYQGSGNSATYTNVPSCHSNSYLSTGSNCFTAVCSSDCSTVNVGPFANDCDSHYTGCDNDGTCEPGQGETTANCLSDCPLPSTYTYTVTVSPPGTGSVSPSGGSGASGARVTLTATASTGYAFNHWEVNGNNVGTDSSYTLPLTSDKTIIAYFDGIKCYNPTTDACDYTSDACKDGKSSEFLTRATAMCQGKRPGEKSCGVNTINDCKNCDTVRITNCNPPTPSCQTINDVPTCVSAIPVDGDGDCVDDTTGACLKYEGGNCANVPDFCVGMSSGRYFCADKIPDDTNNPLTTNSALLFNCRNSDQTRLCGQPADASSSFTLSSLDCSSVNKICTYREDGTGATCAAPSSTCGNGQCDTGEEQTCPGDCQQSSPGPGGGTYDGPGCCQCSDPSHTLPTCYNDVTLDQCPAECATYFFQKESFFPLTEYKGCAPSGTCEKRYCEDNTGYCRIGDASAPNSCFVKDVSSGDQKAPDYCPSHQEACTKCSDQPRGYAWCGNGGTASGTDTGGNKFCQGEGCKMLTCDGCSGSLNYDCKWQCTDYGDGHPTCLNAAPGTDDSDGDGFSVARGDCDPNDPRIYPGASVDCYNGRDNDCDGVTDKNQQDCWGTRNCFSKDFIGLHNQKGICKGQISVKACADGYDSVGSPNYVYANAYLCVDGAVYSCGSDPGPAALYPGITAYTSSNALEMTPDGSSCKEWVCNPTAPYEIRWQQRSCDFNPTTAPCGDNDGVCPSTADNPCYSDGTGPHDPNCNPSPPVCGDSNCENGQGGTTDKGENTTGDTNYCALDCLYGGQCPDGKKWDTTTKQCVDVCTPGLCGDNANCVAIGGQAVCACQTNVPRTLGLGEVPSYFVNCGVEGKETATGLVALITGKDPSALTTADVYPWLFRFTTPGVGCSVNLAANTCCDFNNAFCSIDTVPGLEFGYYFNASLSPVNLEQGGTDGERIFAAGSYLKYGTPEDDVGWVDSYPPTLNTVYGNNLFYGQSCDPGIFYVNATGGINTLRGPDWYGSTTPAGSGECCIDGRIKPEGTLLSDVSGAFSELPDAVVCHDGQMHLCNINLAFSTPPADWVINSPSDAQGNTITLNNQLYVCAPKAGVTYNESHILKGLGEWTPGSWKLDWDNNPDNGMYCADSQCFYDNPVQGKMCVDDGMYGLDTNNRDHICANGTWSTRTKEVASVLYDWAIQSQPENITLYCNGFERALMPSSAEIYSGIFDNTNNICVLSLSYSQVKRGVIYATSFSEIQPTEIQCPQSDFDYTQSAYQLCVSSSDEVIFYNPGTMIAVYTSVMDGQPSGYYEPLAFKQSFADYITDTYNPQAARDRLDTVQSYMATFLQSTSLRYAGAALSYDAPYINGTHNSDVLYISRNATGFIRAVGFVDSSYNPDDDEIRTFFMIDYPNQCSTRTSEDYLRIQAEKALDNATVDPFYKKQSGGYTDCFVFTTDYQYTAAGILHGIDSGQVNDIFGKLTAPQHFR